MATTKRLNFDVSPEQEADIGFLRTALRSSSNKETLVRAVRILLALTRAAELGGELVIRRPDGSLERLLIPDIEPAVPRWKYLVNLPHPWRNQPWIKGRRLLASTVWRDMLANQLSPEEVAEDHELPLEAVVEAVSWSEANRQLIELESLEELRRMQAHGAGVGLDATAG